MKSFKEYYIEATAKKRNSSIAKDRVKVPSYQDEVDYLNNLKNLFFLELKESKKDKTSDELSDKLETSTDEFSNNTTTEISQLKSKALKYDLKSNRTREQYEMNLKNLKSKLASKIENDDRYNSNLSDLKDKFIKNVYDSSNGDYLVYRDQRFRDKKDGRPILNSKVFPEGKK